MADDIRQVIQKSAVEKYLQDNNYGTYFLGTNYSSSYININDFRFLKNICGLAPVPVISQACDRARFLELLVV